MLLWKKTFNSHIFDCDPSVLILEVREWITLGMNFQIILFRDYIMMKVLS